VLEHPAFKAMIGIAARATKGIVIPNRKATRQEIKNLFKKNLADLRTRLNVCGMVPYQHYPDNSVRAIKSLGKLV
jgi:hypothetical protein